MTKQKLIEYDAEVVQLLPDGRCLVKLPNVEEPILAYTAGRLRKRNVKMLPQDRVKIEMSPYDITKARIVDRYRTRS